MNVDTCSTANCNGHGGCIGDPPTCNCWHGWEGDKCTTDPCSNCAGGSGICDTYTAGICMCLPGFHNGAGGNSCNVDIMSQQGHCQGSWGPWGPCSSCFKKRTYTVSDAGSAAGRPCPYADGAEQKVRCARAGTPQCCGLQAGDCNSGQEDMVRCECICPANGPGGPYCDLVVQDPAALEGAVMQNTRSLTDFQVANPDPSTIYEDVDLLADEPTAPPPPPGFPVWAIILIVLGVLILIGVFIWWYRRRKRLQQEAAMMEYAGFDAGGGGYGGGGGADMGY